MHDNEAEFVIRVDVSDRLRCDDLAGDFYFECLDGHCYAVWPDADLDSIRRAQKIGQKGSPMSGGSMGKFVYHKR
jgi:hypothetical protein